MPTTIDFPERSICGVLYQLRYTNESAVLMERAKLPLSTVTSYISEALSGGMALGPFLRIASFMLVKQNAEGKWRLAGVDELDLAKMLDDEDGVPLGRTFQWIVEGITVAMGKAFPGEKPGDRPMPERPEAIQ